jgi:hypothetical protein
MEIVVSSHTLFQQAGRIGQLRRQGNETAAMALERDLNALVARADRISLGMTVGRLSEILHGIRRA